MKSGDVKEAAQDLNAEFNPNDEGSSWYSQYKPNATTLWWSEVINSSNVDNCLDKAEGRMCSRCCLCGAYLKKISGAEHVASLWWTAGHAVDTALRCVYDAFRVRATLPAAVLFTHYSAIPSVIFLGSCWSSKLFLFLNAYLTENTSGNHGPPYYARVFPWPVLSASF